MLFCIVRDDIAHVHADVLVNAANEQLAEGGGVCGALFAGAGRHQMREACDALAPCPTGSAVATPGFNLDCTYVVHAVGPVWMGGKRGEEKLLRSCYRAIFAQVKQLGVSSVAFPLISAGIYGYPIRAALAIAREETAAFLAEHDDIDAMLVVFDRGVIAAGTEFLDQIEAFIEDVDGKQSSCNPRKGHAPAPDGATALLALIDKRGLTDAEVCRRANISRQVLSEIRSNPAYELTKPTAVALWFALELDLHTAQELLARAECPLSRSSKFDVIVEFFLTRQIYDVMQVNEALFAFDQPQLGSHKPRS